MRTTGATRQRRRDTAAAIGVGLFALGVLLLGMTRAGAQDPPDSDSGSCCGSGEVTTVTETVTEDRTQPPGTVTETVTVSEGSPITVASPPVPPGGPAEPPASTSTAIVALTGLGAGGCALAAVMLVTRLRRPGGRRAPRRTPEVRAVGRSDPNPQTTTEGRAGPTIGIDFRARPWDIRVRGEAP